MSERCTCCRNDDAREDGLCSGCHNDLCGIDALTETMRTHVLAHALTRSHKDVAARLACTTVAHKSALCNAARATGIARDTLVRAARYGMRTGRWGKPSCFEDVTVPGAEQVSQSGEVTVSYREPEPRREAKKRPPEPKAYQWMRKDQRETAPTEATTTEPTIEEEPPVIETDPYEDEEQPTGVDPAEIVKAREYLEQARAEHQQAFAGLAMAALSEEGLRYMEVARTAYRYGRALGGFEVLSAMAAEQ